MEPSSAPYSPWLTNMMLNPVEPALLLFTPEQLAGFMRENIDDPIAQNIADFIIVTRMCGRDFVYLTEEGLEVLSRGFPVITETLMSFQVQTVILSPRARFRPLDDVFSELSSSSSASSDEQVTSDMESNYWSPVPSRSPSPDGSLSSADDDSYHDASSHSGYTSSPALSPPSSPRRPSQMMTDLSANSDFIVLDFAFSTLDDDELRSLYPRLTTHLTAMIYQEQGVNEADVSLPASSVNDTTSPPTLAPIAPGSSRNSPPLNLGDASPRTITIDDHTEPCSPSHYHLHDSVPPLAGPFSSALGFDSQRNSPVTTHGVEIIGARRWDLASKPASLPISLPIPPGESWGPGGGSAVSIPTDPFSSQSVCPTTSIAGEIPFAFQVPQEWLSKGSDEVDTRPKLQITPGFRATFSDRTAPMSQQSATHDQSDGEIEDGDIMTLDPGGDSTSPSLPLDITTYSLLDDDEISPLLFSTPSLPTRRHINPALAETRHDRKLSLDATDRTLWPSGSAVYRRRTLSSPTVVRPRVPKSQILTTKW